MRGGGGRAREDLLGTVWGENGRARVGGGGARGEGDKGRGGRQRERCGGRGGANVLLVVADFQSCIYRGSRHFRDKVLKNLAVNNI